MPGERGGLRRDCRRDYVNKALEFLVAQGRARHEPTLDDDRGRTYALNDRFRVGIAEITESLVFGVLARRGTPVWAHGTGRRSRVRGLGGRSLGRGRPGGPRAVTLREVGARAGVSHNTPYWHFADKRDLLVTVAAACPDDLAKRIREVSIPGRSGAERVQQAALAYLNWASEPHEELGTAADTAVQAMRDGVTAAVTDDSRRVLPTASPP